jgi:hypothetical protein
MENKYYRSPENRKKISDSLKKYFSNPEVKKELSKKNSGKNNPRYGIPLSYKKREEMHYKMLGKNNHQWKDGRDIRSYDFKFNINFRKSIRKRDNYICMLCNKHQEVLNKTLAIHHINYDPLLTIPENCITLCNSCHSKTNGNRKEWINFFHSLLNNKYNYKYEDDKVVLDLIEVSK